jgi:nitroreductase
LYEAVYCPSTDLFVAALEFPALCSGSGALASVSDLIAAIQSLPKGATGMHASSASELTEFLRSLRQTRSFSSQPVPDEVLNAILEVARWTGSGGNKQPWRLVVLREPANIARIAALKADTGWITAAPVVIAVVMSGKSADAARFDAGRLVERMMLAATANGLAAAVIGFGAADSEPAQGARSLLNVPDELWPTHAVVIGYPGPADADQGGKRGGRKPLGDIIVAEQFPAE